MEFNSGFKGLISNSSINTTKLTPCKKYRVFDRECSREICGVDEVLALPCCYAAYGDSFLQTFRPKVHKQLPTNAV